MALLTGGQRLGLTSTTTTASPDLSASSNKSVVFVKLTDSAYAAIANYIKRQQKQQHQSNSKPTIQFSEQSGTLSVPNNEGNNASTFRFNLSSTDDQNGPQGSFECIGCFNKGSVDAVGPLQNKLTVHASADAYQRFGERINEAKKESNKRSTVLLDRKPGRSTPAAGFSKGVRQRPYHASPTAPQPSKPASHAMSSLASSFAPSSRNEERFSGHHSTAASGIAGPPLSTNHPLMDRYSSSKSSPYGNKPGNPDIMKRPLRERIAHLLAVRPYKKPELILRINRDGVLEKDRKNICVIVRQVAHTKDNTYHLARHMWNDVSEEWPFYTEEDKAAFRRSKPQNLTPPASDGSSSSIGSGLSSSSSRPASPQAIVGGPSLKRNHHRELASQGGYYDHDGVPPPKRKRVSKYVRPREMQYGGSGSDCGGKSPMLDSRSPRLSNYRRSPDSKDSNVLGSSLGGSLSGNVWPFNEASRVSPARQQAVTNQYPPVNTSPLKCHRHHRRRLSSSSSTSSRSASLANETGMPVSPPCVGGGGAEIDAEPHHHRRRADNMAVSLQHDDYENLNEASAPMQTDEMEVDDSDMTTMDNTQRLDEDWRKDYSRIQNEEQRRLYKKDYTKNYKQYLILHKKYSDYLANFNSLKEQLSKQLKGSNMWKDIEVKLMKEHERLTKNGEFLQLKKDFNRLHQKMEHIKQMVQDYDTEHTHKRSLNKYGERTEKSRMGLVTSR